jgi:nucleotide-binding universal stress UspA family protein
MKVLIPTDFSKSARAAFDYAYQLFNHTEDTQFVLLNSYEMPASGSAGGVMMSLEEAMRKESENDLKLEISHLEKTYPGVHVSSVSRYGTLENSVSRTNNEKDIDFVVMGTHGASGLKKALIGSNTMKVIENVARPVISVPAGWNYKEIKDIVYATDLKRLENLDSLKPLCKLAEVYDSTIHIVYVTDENADIDLEKEVGKLPLNEMFSKRTRKFKVIHSDDVAESIDNYVDEINADLTVIIPKAASFWDKLFNRSVTVQMAFNTKAPMLAIKDI